jgi:hypothetical protein
MAPAQGAQGARPAAPPDAEWMAYARLEEARWARQAPRVAAMGAWAARELAPLLPPGRPVFYPFAGPDALHALALFGGAPRLVLVGLEPVGALPEPGRAPAQYFERLGAAMSDVHRLTFFRTRAMASEFERDGVLGALVATIARAGGLTTNIEVLPSPAAGSVPQSSGRARAGARITWTAADGSARRLDYLSADLSNAGFRTHAQLAADLHALAPCTVFLKAASYLLAEARFSALRQAIVADAAALVQDDTGIPFAHLGERWTTRLYGRYEAPGSPFEDREQSDLRAAYERRATSPLPFGFGYHVEARRSNLMVAVKAP